MLYTPSANVFQHFVRHVFSSPQPHSTSDLLRRHIVQIHMNMKTGIYRTKSDTKTSRIHHTSKENGGGIKVCRQSRKTFLLLYCLFFLISLFLLFYFFPTICVLRFLCHFSSDLSHNWPVGR